MTRHPSLCGAMISYGGEPRPEYRGLIELALAPSDANVVYASISQPDGNHILGRRVRRG